MVTLGATAAPEQRVASSAALVRLSYWQHAGLFLLACLIVFSRRPDAIFHAQFYAEDGACWFADAYNRGWLHVLFLPWHGIFQTVPRLTAGPALLVPLWAAPALLNCFQIALEALPVSILLSSRSAAWGNFPFRAAMAVLYLALPNSSEITYGIAWAMWPMALAAVLLLVAALPQGWKQRTAEAVFLLLMGLSGPMCILLLPLSAYLVWKRPHRWRRVQCSILLGSAAAQGFAMRILDPHGRPYYGLHITPASFTRIVGGNVFWGALLGRSLPPQLGGSDGLMLLAAITAGGLFLLGWCFAHAGLEMRLLLAFAAMLLTASVARPTEYPPPGMTIWNYLAQSPDIRYWFLPSLAFAWAILWCWQYGSRPVKACSALLLGVMAVGMVLHWEHPPLPDLHFPQYVARFQSAPPGTVVSIPENPIHSGWEIKLIKR